jgi:uncharacterized protein (DUF1778 family)
MDMARPPKRAEDRKNVDLRIPVTQAQKDLIMQAAGLDQLDMAEWARSLLLKAATQRLKREEGQSK